MIDFLATRTTTDPQTAACARLLTTVITHAIKDACTPLNKEEKLKCKNIDTNARKSIDFLFGKESIFPLYASLIGTSAESIRRALLELEGGGISDMDRRVLSVRRRWERDLVTWGDV